MKKTTVSVTQRAVLQRINRVLAKKQEAIKSDRRGTYMHIDLKRNSVVELDVNIAEKAEELSVLKPWEFME